MQVSIVARNVVAGTTADIGRIGNVNGVTTVGVRSATEIIHVGGVAGMDAPDAFSAAMQLADMPDVGSGHDNDPGALLEYHSLRSLRGDRLEVAAHYARPGSIALPTDGTFALRDLSGIAVEETDMVPGSRAPMRLTWVDPANDKIKVEDTVKLPHEWQRRKLIAQAVLSTRPPLAVLQAFRKVNAQPWQGLPAAYWKFDTLDVSTSNYQTFTITCGFSTRQDEDWSQHVILSDAATGKYVPIGAGVVAELLGRPYAQGFMVGGTGARAGKEGIGRLCGYFTANFASIFGL